MFYYFLRNPRSTIEVCYQFALKLLFCSIWVKSQCKQLISSIATKKKREVWEGVGTWNIGFPSWKYRVIYFLEIKEHTENDFILRISLFLPIPSIYWSFITQKQTRWKRRNPPAPSARPLCTAARTTGRLSGGAEWRPSSLNFLAFVNLSVQPWTLFEQSLVLNGGLYRIVTHSVTHLSCIYFK